MSECVCEDWGENIELIDSAILIQALHTVSGRGYRGKPFEYCPWCGEKLKTPTNK